MVAIGSGNSYYNPYVQTQGNNYNVNPITRVSRETQADSYVKTDKAPVSTTEKLAKGDINAVLDLISKLPEQDLKALERTVAFQKERSFYASKQNTNHEIRLGFLGKISEAIASVKNDRPKEIAKNETTTNPFAPKEVSKGERLSLFV